MCRFVSGWRSWLAAVAGVIAVALASGAIAAETFDIVIQGGRLMDPHTHTDRIANVGIRGGTIARISDTRLAGTRVIDARGLVVAPGFIDLHAHGQAITAQDLQVRDGVTTALDMELGVYPVEPYYREHEGRARIHYGASASHYGIRVKVTAGMDVGHMITNQEISGRLYAARAKWADATLSAEQRAAALAAYEEAIAAGALGLGLAIEYTPGADRAEIYEFFRAAARHGAPVFAHVRMAHTGRPGGLLEMVQEVLANAAATGAPLHIVHVTSKGLGDTPLILEAIRGARTRGLDITTEAYPYAAGSTAIGAAVFDEGWQERWNASYEDVEWVATGERLTEQTFNEYRRSHPGAPVIFHMIPEGIVEAAIADPLVMIASDGGPFTGGRGHPRGAGTFSRVLGHYVRERRALSLMDALAKMTIMPAQRLEHFVPAMRNKGRLQEGADADITVFDPESIIDRATYGDPAQPSTGIAHVIVGGVPVVLDSVLQTDVYPGRPVRGNVVHDRQ